MPKIEDGTVVGIPCTVSTGPFSDEKLISFQAVSGAVSGFVGESELQQSAGRWTVKALVESTDSKNAEVRVRGSFFTTNGVATVSLSDIRRD